MVLLLTRISIDEFESLEDKREYLTSKSCKFFELDTNLSKSKLYDILKMTLIWYSIWSNSAIYVNIMSDNYWHKICGNLINSSRIVNYTDIPSVVTDINDPYYNDYNKVEISDRIFSDDDINSIINNIKTFNFKNDDIYTVRLG